jgi:hypothetical protein
MKKQVHLSEEMEKKMINNIYNDFFINGRNNIKQQNQTKNIQKNNKSDNK